MQSNEFFEPEPRLKRHGFPRWRLPLLLAVLALLAWKLFLQTFYASVGGMYNGYIGGDMGEKMGLNLRIRQSGREVTGGGKISRQRGAAVKERRLNLAGTISGNHLTLQGGLGSGQLVVEGDVRNGELTGVVRFLQTGDPYDTCGFVLKPVK
jgi:hypothetical protein